MLACAIWSGSALVGMGGCNRNTRMPTQTGVSIRPSIDNARARGGGPRATLTDSEIARITTVASATEIEQGRLAAEQAESPAVRDFANRMVAEHRLAAAQQQELLGHLNKSAVDSATSRLLSIDGVETMRTLRSTSGSAFDRVYIDAQIREHQQLLTMLDSQLIPSAEELGLRAQLERVRDTGAMHLSHALSVRARLVGGSEAPPVE